MQDNNHTVGVIINEATWRVAELASLRAMVTPLENLAGFVFEWRTASQRARLMRMANSTSIVAQAEADVAEQRAYDRMDTYLGELVKERNRRGISEPPGGVPVKTVIADPAVSPKRLLRYTVDPQKVYNHLALALGAVAKDAVILGEHRLLHDVVNTLSHLQNDAALLMQGNTEVTLVSEEEE